MTHAVAHVRRKALCVPSDLMILLLIECPLAWREKRIARGALALHCRTIPFFPPTLFCVRLSSAREFLPSWGRIATGPELGKCAESPQGLLRRSPPSMATTWSTAAEQALATAFRISPQLDAARCAELAAQSGTTPDTVRAWFQGRQSALQEAAQTPVR